jgi:hypothetical protein
MPCLVQGNSDWIYFPLIVLCDTLGGVVQLPSGNVENNWPTFQDGTGKAAFSPFCRVHVLRVRSVRQHKGVTLRDEPSYSAPTGSNKQFAALLDGLF